MFYQASFEYLFSTEMAYSQQYKAGGSETQGAEQKRRQVFQGYPYEEIGGALDYINQKIGDDNACYMTLFRSFHTYL